MLAVIVILARRRKAALEVGVWLDELCTRRVCVVANDTTALTECKPNTYSAARLRMITNTKYIKEARARHM